MAGGPDFNPAEFEAYKSQAGGGFNPSEFEAFKAQAARGPGPQTASDLVFGGEDPSSSIRSADAPAGRVIGTPGALYAGASSAMYDMPIVGPTLTDASNKLAAGLRSYMHGTPYADELKSVESYDTKAREDHPIANKLGGVAGGVIGLAPLAAAAPELIGAGVASLPARVGLSGLSGGLIGGADAAARGGDLGKVETGAALGGAFGLAGPAVGAAVGAGVRKAGEFAAEKLAPIAGYGRDAARTLYDAVRSSGGADAVRGTVNGYGTPAMLLDAGTDFNGLARGIATQPTTRSIILNPLEARAEGASARILADTDRALGPAAEPALVERARQRSYQEHVPPLYNDALGNAGPVNTADVLATIGRLRDAEKGPAADGLRDAWNLLHRETEVPGVGRAMVPDQRADALHNAKEALDSLIHAAEAKYGSAGASAYGRLSEARAALNNALETQVPGYGNANRVAQDYILAGKALETGQTLLNGGRTAVRPQQLAMDTEAMSPMQQFLQRLGLRAEVDNKLRTNLNDRLALRGAVMGEGDYNRARMNTVFGDEPTQQLANVVNREGVFENSRQTIARGSDTARNQASEKAVAVPDVSSKGGDILPAAIGTATAGLGGGALAVLGKLGLGGINTAASTAQRAAAISRNQEIGRALTLGPGEQLDALLNAIQRRGQYVEGAGRVGDAARVLGHAATIPQGNQAQDYLPESLLQYARRR